MKLVFSSIHNDDIFEPDFLKLLEKRGTLDNMK